MKMKTSGTICLFFLLTIAVFPDITEASWKRKVFSPTVKRTAASLVAWEGAFYGIEWGLDKYLDKAKDKATKEMLDKKDSGTGIKEYKEPPSEAGSPKERR